MDSINKDYVSYGKADYDLYDISTAPKRGKGGVAILWRNYLTKLDIDDDRLIGIDLALSGNKHIVIIINGIYLPGSDSTLYDYKERLEKLRGLYS